MTRTLRIDKKELYLSSIMTLKHAESPDPLFSCLMTLYGHFGETERFNFQVLNTLIYLEHQNPCIFAMQNSDSVASSIITLGAYSK